MSTIRVVELDRVDVRLSKLSFEELLEVHGINTQKPYFTYENAEAQYWRIIQLDYPLCGDCERWARKNLNVIKMFQSDPVTLQDYFKKGLCTECHNNLLKTMEAVNGDN